MFVENILPSALSSFYFFDGEKIAELAVAKTDDQMKESIRSMLGITILDVLKNDLGRIIRKTSKKKFTLETLQAAEEKHPRRATAKVAAKKADAPIAKKQEGKKVRIKEEKIRESIIKYLTDVYPNSMSAGEIFEKLKKEGLPNTQSFRTRVYGKLGVWTKEGLLARPERGVYQIVKK